MLPSIPTRWPNVPAFSAAAMLAILVTSPAAGQDAVDLSNRAREPWRLVNRNPVIVTEASRPVLRFDERAGGGIAWNPMLTLADGDVDVDVRGRNVLQKSFVGVAFHMASDSEFEVVWLRPFNYESADSTRRSHGIQYAAYPTHSWEVLRAEHPGGYEASVPADTKPDAWAHLHVELRGTSVRVFLNGAAAPVLAVEGRGGRTTGGVGLFVGDQSTGDFANLRVRPVPTPVASPAQERYGFLALLGRDTISVERVSRTPGKLVSDEVERFPRVLQRHTEILLAPDMSVRHLTMAILMPTATTVKWRERHLTVEYLRDSIRVSLRNSEGNKKLTLATAGALTMPWVSQMYSLTELYVAAALRRGGDSIAVRQFYPDADVEDFPIYGGFVRSVSGGKAELFRHDGLAGVGEATVDAQGRMVSYSGARTTYRMEVTRLATLPNIEAIAAQFAATERAKGVASDLSHRDTTRATIGGADLLVDYGRPLARGRELLGNVIPYDMVWRTGANAATQFTTSAAITLGGLELAPGTYTLWTLPSRTGASLIVNRQFKQWGTQYDAAKDLGRAPLETETSTAPVERFTISVVATESTQGTLRMEWGSFRWTAPIVAK